MIENYENLRENTYFLGENVQNLEENSRIWRKIS